MTKTILLTMFYLQPNSNVDYFENNCLSFDAKHDEDSDDHTTDAKDHKNNIGMNYSKGGTTNMNRKPNELSCNFKATKGRILKTVDSVYQNVTSLEDCRLKCVAANFR